MSRVENLRIDFPNWHLHIATWDLPDQGIMALLGPSGSGKTTLVRALLGLEPCAQLNWWWKDVDLAQLPIGERRLGVVFQQYQLFPHMTAGENIIFGAEVRSIPAETAQISFEQLVKELQLETCLNTKAKHLSGGEQQRVALARALIGQPRFLFLDEPFSALDQNLKVEARALVKKVLSLYKVPALLITHDDADVRALADQVVRLEDGTIKI